MTRNRLRIAAALVLAFAFVAVPSTATAAPLSSMGLPNPFPDPDPNDVPGIGTPQGNRPVPTRARNFMLNILGSMLGQATPDSWRREQLAYQNRFNFGHEQLEQWYRQSTASGMPDSMADYVLREQERNLASHGRTTLPNGVTVVGNGATSRPPLTGTARLTDIGGRLLNAGTALSGGSLGFSLGYGFGKWGFEADGFDVNGALCAADEDAAGFLSLITGTPCPDVAAQTEEWLSAVQSMSGVSGGLVCTPNGAYCAQLINIIPWEEQGSTVQRTAACFRTTGTAPSGMRIAVFTNGAGGATYAIASQPGWLSGSMSAFQPKNPSYVKPTNVGMACGMVYGGAGLAYNPGQTGHAPFTRYAMWDANARTMGTPTELVEAGADSMQALQCTVIVQGGGSYVQNTGEYRAGDGNFPIPMCPEIPDGEIPAEVRLDEVGPNGTTPVYSQPTTPAAQDWMGTYPECTLGQCKLDLLKTEGADTFSCFDREASCARWFTEPNREEVYQCRYGDRDVAISECNVYSAIFDPQRVQAGAPYSDPVTGEWSGGQSSPAAGSALMGQTIQNPERARNCLPTGWAMLNPIEWVLQPTQCALEWAFVPRATVVEVELLRHEAAWEGTPPTVIANAVGSWTTAPSISGCSRSVTVMGVTFDIVNACPGSPLAPIAEISRLVINVSFVVMVIVVIRRQIAGTVDYNVSTS